MTRVATTDEALTLRTATGEGFLAFAGPATIINLPYRGDRREAFAAQLPGIDLSLDHPLYVTRVTNPPFGVQRLSQSDIHAVDRYDRLPALRQASSLLRRLRRRKPRRA